MAHTEGLSDRITAYFSKSRELLQPEKTTRERPLSASSWDRGERARACARSIRPPGRGGALGLLARDELRNLLQALRRRHRSGPAMRLVLAVQKAAFIMRVRGRLHPRL